MERHGHYLARGVRYPGPRPDPLHYPDHCQRDQERDNNDRRRVLDTHLRKERQDGDCPGLPQDQDNHAHRLQMPVVR
jgi:hypothetical protein